MCQTPGAENTIRQCRVCWRFLCIIACQIREIRAEQASEVFEKSKKKVMLMRSAPSYSNRALRLNEESHALVRFLFDMHFAWRV